MLSTADGSIDFLPMLSTNDESIDDLLAMLSTADESIDDWQCYLLSACGLAEQRRTRER